MLTKEESGKPLYEQLRRALRRDILSGTYPPGTQLPSETELGRRYSVSRITVRRAVQELSQEGILVRIQGKGTFVLSNDTRLQMNAQGSLWEALELQGHKLEAQVLCRSSQVWDQEMGWMLGVDCRPCAFFRRILKEEETPLILEEVYFLPERLAISAQELEWVPFCQFAGRKGPYGRIRREIRTVKASQQTADLLCCGEGQAVFQITQVCCSPEGVPMVVSRSYFPGNRYCFLMDEGGLQFRASMDFERVLSQNTSSC